MAARSKATANSSLETKLSWPLKKSNRRLPCLHFQLVNVMKGGFSLHGTGKASKSPTSFETDSGLLVCHSLRHLLHSQHLQSL